VDGQVGQGSYRVGFLPGEDVTVAAHGQLDGRMSHEALGRLRMNASSGQQTARCVAQAMKVGKPAGGVLVRQETALLAFLALGRLGGVDDPCSAGVGQVRLEHAG
jgi:hypothetical protein